MVGYLAATVFYVRVNMTSYIPTHQIGSVDRRDFITKDSVDDKAIYNKFGYVVANGEQLKPEWELTKSGILKGTAFEKMLPDFLNRYITVKK